MITIIPPVMDFLPGRIKISHTVQIYSLHTLPTSFSKVCRNCVWNQQQLQRSGIEPREIVEEESKTSLNLYFCHAGFSGIFLQEGFPTTGNDIQVALLMTVLVTVIMNPCTQYLKPRN